jgi:hypothetical protein
MDSKGFIGNVALCAEDDGLIEKAGNLVIEDAWKRQESPLATAMHVFVRIAQMLYSDIYRIVPLESESTDAGREVFLLFLANALIARYDRSAMPCTIDGIKEVASEVCGRHGFSIIHA